MYTPDMLGPDGKPKNGGPQQLSAAQAFASRTAAKRRPSPAEPTIQDPSDLLASLNSGGKSAGVPEDQKECKAPAKRAKGRAGGQGTAGGTGKNDLRAAGCHPSHTDPH
jgi:hypothetical protein